jgi:hypothetical protein
MSKHTTGEWKIDIDNIVADRYICRIYDYSTEKTNYPEENKKLKEESIANAKLMAAAPVMLKALQTIIDGGECNFSIETAMEALKELK